MRRATVGLTKPKVNDAQDFEDLHISEIARYKQYICIIMLSLTRIKKLICQ